MNTIFEKLKRKIVSRLTDEIDIFYYDEKNQIDHKIAQISYKDRQVIVDKTHEINFYYKKNDEYVWKKHYWTGTSDKKKSIEEAKIFIKDDSVWMI